MLTQVILEGALGKRFGREWNLAIDSPAEALRIIDANEPGLFTWIKSSLAKYGRYQVVCEFADGRIVELDNDTIFLQAKPCRVTFVPLTAGAGGAAKFVVGAVLAVVGYAMGWTGVGMIVGNIGVAMMLGGAIEMLSPRPSTSNDQNQKKNGTNTYFDGPVNTSMQGVPVQLLYGTVLCGSHTISAALTIDEVQYVPPASDIAPPPVDLFAMLMNRDSG